MSFAKHRILALNGGSSSIKFASYEVAEPLRLSLRGKVERIGASGTALMFFDENGEHREPFAAKDLTSAANSLVEWLEGRNGFESLRAVGRRVVHGLLHEAPEVVTEELLAELRRISPFDPDHLPGEIALIEVIRKRSPQLLQVACFDTAFHAHMPPVARTLPIPRRFGAKGVRRTRSLR